MKAGPNGQREADFISCVAFNNVADFTEKYLHQGSKIAVTGRIQTGSYTNREGQKVYTTEVIVNTQEFAESAQKPQQGGYQQQPNNYQSAPQQPVYRPQEAPQAPQYKPQEEYQQQTLNDGFMDVSGLDDAGIPWN
jgi:single-strand DNA-binding protein